MFPIAFEENRTIDETSQHDPQDDQQSILSRSLLARYGAALRRRRDRLALGQRSPGLSRANLKAIAVVCWVLLAIGAVLLGWRAVVYAGRLIAYTEFVQSGITTQATVIGRRSTDRTTRYSPHRYAITYWFQVGDRRVIRIDGVGRETYEAQYVDDPVVVVYLARDPKVSIIQSELKLPWPAGPAALLAGCVVVFVLACTTTRRLKRRVVVRDARDRNIGR